MKQTIGNKIFNTDSCQKHRRHTRITREELTPRVFFIKTELLCTQKHDTSCYFNWVTVDKYIDDIKVKSYSWIQDVDPDELKEFLSIDLKPPRDNRLHKSYYKSVYDSHLKPSPEELHERKKKQSRDYYHTHKEELLKKKKEHYITHKDEHLQKSKQYYQEHKDTWKIKYNYKKYIKD